jgi:hypothetical protein
MADGLAGFSRRRLPRDLENLREPRDRLVDRSRREGASRPAMQASPLVHVLVDQGLAPVGRGARRVGLRELRLAVAIHLGDRYLREPMVLEERQQVV